MEDTKKASFSVSQLDAHTKLISTIKIHKHTRLHNYLKEGNPTEYGSRQLPQGEPKMIEIGGKEVIVFSHWEYGMKASIFGYCLSEGREIF